MLRFVPLLLAAAVSVADAESPLRWSELPPLPDAQGFAGTFAGVSGGSLIVAGGANFPDAFPWDGGAKIYHDTIHVLDFPNGTWRVSEQRLPTPVGYGVSVSLPSRDAVLCMGGNDETGATNEVYELVASGGRITIRRDLPPLPLPATMGCAEVIGEVVYFAGGESDGSTHRQFHRLDLREKERRWEALPWPEGAPGRILAVAGARDGHFYLISGCDLGSSEWDGRTYLRDAWSYDPPTKAWRRLADLPNAVAAAPSPALPVGSAHLLVMGGSNRALVDAQRALRPATGGNGVEHPGFPPTVMAYHTITNTWVETGEMPAPAPVTTPAVTWLGRLVLPTGEIKPGIRSPQILACKVEPSPKSFGFMNWTVVTAYLGGMVGIGIWFAKRGGSTDDFFRGGQRIPWWVAGLSIFATMLSAITFMAIPAQAYAKDASFYIGQLPILIVVPLVIAFYLPYFRRLDITSAYEYLEKRFNLATRLFASLSFILFHIGRIAIVLYLPAIALAEVSSIGVIPCIMVIGVICVIYTVIGGIEAVVWTDAVQALALLGGALLCLCLVVVHVDGGVPGVWRTVAEDGRLFQNLTFDLDVRGGTTSIFILFAAFLFNALVPYTSGQDVVQRYVTTPTQADAARSLRTTMWLGVFGSAIFFALGLALYVFYKEFPQQLDPAMARNDGILPFFVMQQLPVGVAGLVVAAIFAASQSTVSSSLNSVATAYVTDFHRRVFAPDNPDRRNLAVARLVVVLIGIAGIGVACVMAQARIDSAFTTFNSLIGLTAGSLGGVFALGIFNPRANGSGAFLGCLTGFGVVLALYLTKAPVTGLLYALVGCVTCFASGSLFSLAFPRDIPKHP